MKTYIAKPKDIKRAWYVVDAKDKILGRLASAIATVLMGKNKVIYDPHQDVGDGVIVINADKVRVTGNKLMDKTYKSYSGYPRGLNEETLATMMTKRPDYVVRHAVKGMLPKNKLAARMLKKLHVYAGETHPHKAQAAKELKV